jgi:hypothetical protein
VRPYEARFYFGINLPLETFSAYSGFVAASMSVQPVSSVLCQIPLKKENFCRPELFFFLWVFFARGWFHVNYSTHKKF